MRLLAVVVDECDIVSGRASAPSTHPVAPEMIMIEHRFTLPTRLVAHPID
ncbi:MAG: hypothetical protein ACREUE_08690 [Panacagrimonas sp.]